MLLTPATPDAFPFKAFLRGFRILTVECLQLHGRLFIE